MVKMGKSAFQIVSDSSCDLPLEMARNLKIRIVPFYVSFDGEHYKKEIEEISVRDFYQEMVEQKKVYPKSSLPSVEDYIQAFLPFAKEGIPVICICITTKFSGSCNSALNAAGAIKEQYPEAKIAVIDSTVNTVLQGLFVLEASRMQEDGLSWEEAVENLERIKTTGRILFTIGSMDYLQKGGRIGKVVGVLGSTLKIMPLIQLREGEIFPTGIIRNRKKGLARLIEQVGEYFRQLHENPRSYSLAVGYGYDYEEAAAFRDDLFQSLKSSFHIDPIPIYQIGAAIGVHTGPYPLGVGLIRRYDS